MIQNGTAADWRKLQLHVRWDRDGTDFSPSADQLAQAIRAHDETMRARLADGPAGSRDLHLLYGRWVYLVGVLKPHEEAPFQVLAGVCADLGWGLSAALEVGAAPYDNERLSSVARWLTRIEVHLAPVDDVRDTVLIEAIDQLAQSRAALVFRGDIDRYRAIGATNLPSLNNRPHEFRRDVSPLVSHGTPLPAD